MTEEHVPVEELAAYAAGDLDATASLAVEAHVVLCAQCRADADAVARATAALATLPPVPMPVEVADRVDAALAAAAASPAGPVGNVLPLAPKRRRPSLAGIAAVAAGIALLGAISVPFLDRADKDPGTVSALAERGDTKRLESGLNYRHGELSSTLLRALGGVRDEAGRTEALQRTSAQDSNTGGTGGVGGVTAAPAAPTPSGAEVTSGKGAVPAAAPPLNLSSFQSDPGRLAACVSALAAGQPTIGQTPLLVDFALFDGNPALVVVFPTVRAGAIRADRIDVFVAGPRCGLVAGDDDVLDFARFERPSGL